MAAMGVHPDRATLGPGLVALLAIGMLINYVDRGNLATAAPVIKDALGLSNTEAGILLSAFFWTYMPCQLAAGWLAERINPYRTLAIGVALWSFATLATGLATSFAALLTLRLVLGIGESTTFPCNAKILARDLAPQRLGTVNGLIGAGQAIGPAIGTFGGGLLIAWAGWRSLFLIFGLLSALWLVPWLFALRRVPSQRANADPATPGFGAIIARRECWGAGAGHFAHNYALYFVISWLPLYLVKARGFSVIEMGELGSILYILYAIATQAVGLAADRWMAAGGSSTRVRKSFAITGLVGLAACMLVCAAGTPVLSIVGLLASGLFFAMGSATIFPIGQTLGGPHAAGKWMGVQNCLGNFAGIIAPLITGYVVDRTGSFSIAFAIAAAVTLLGIIGWASIPRIETIDWRER